MNENKLLVQRYLDSLSGKPKTHDLATKFVTDPKLIEHIENIERAFPRYELLIQDLIAEGDLVVVRSEFRGIHSGPFMGIEPTGKSVSAGLIIIYQVQNEKIVNHWMQFDLFSLMAQLRQTDNSVPTASAQQYATKATV